MHCKIKPGLIKVDVREGKNSCRQCFPSLMPFNQIPLCPPLYNAWHFDLAEAMVNVLVQMPSWFCERLQNLLASLHSGPVCSSMTRCCCFFFWLEGSCKPISLQLLIYSKSQKPFPITASCCPFLTFCKGLEKCFIKWNQHFNNKFNIFVNLPMLIMVFLAWLKSGSLCGVAAAKL